MWLLAGDLSFSPHSHLNRDAYNMADGFPRRKRDEGKEEERKERREGGNEDKAKIEAPALEMTCHFLCLLYQTNLVQCEKEVDRDLSMRKWNCWRSSWRLATIPSKYSVKHCEHMKVSNTVVEGDGCSG